MSCRKKREASPTRVALVCLKTNQNNPQINNQSLLKIFSKFGSISKILIFERGQQLTKVFIEYDEVEAAIEAIKSLNNTKVLNQILCNVYHSRLKQLKLDTVPYTKGIDFTTPTNPDKNEWEDFQFENHSTDELTDEEWEPQFSEERKKDIITKLSLIDDEINETIESKIGTALNKLHQNTICLKYRFGLLCDANKVINAFSFFGQVTYLKSTSTHAYIKFSSNKQCQNAYQLLKDLLDLQIVYNFESLGGQLIQPECICNSQSTLSNQLIVDPLVIGELQGTFRCSPIGPQYLVQFATVGECLLAISGMKQSNLQFLSFA